MVWLVTGCEQVEGSQHLVKAKTAELGQKGRGRKHWHGSQRRPGAREEGTKATCVAQEQQDDGDGAPLPARSGCMWHFPLAEARRRGAQVQSVQKLRRVEGDPCSAVTWLQVKLRTDSRMASSFSGVTQLFYGNTK